METKFVENDEVRDPLMDYLEDPFLLDLFNQIRKVGSIKEISLDLTHICNLRCQGCYFFVNELDQNKAPEDDAEFDAFIEREKARGTNSITVLGGEPSLQLDRLRKLAQHFWIVVATNGTIRIPYGGLENITISVSVWGDRETDRMLRGGGKLDVVSRALKNYQGDRRALWYYTVPSGNAHQIEGVVEQCIENGNFVLFNYYGDKSGLGGIYDHQQGFAAVRQEIDRMIARYPDRVLMTPYINKVLSTGKLYGDSWGYDVCSGISENMPENAARFKNGKPYNAHFRAYNPDVKTTRVCCASNNPDCSTCCQTWGQIGWIMLNMEQHLGSKQEFTNWLTTMYLFYLIDRAIDFEAGIKLLPEIQQRVSCESTLRIICN
ncbi:radical SAM protein [Nostoc sp.]|uniref:radical SAM protein n=1 Tax=Nostoc sp. TaxID=1180 RepID=UPI002FF8F426